MSEKTNRIKIQRLKKRNIQKTFQNKARNVLAEDLGWDEINNETRNKDKYFFHWLQNNRIAFFATTFFTHRLYNNF